MDTNIEQASSPDTITQPEQVEVLQTTGRATRHVKKPLLLIILIATFVIGGSSAAYIQYIHNSPEKIWERALSSTSQGLDKLIELNQRDRKSGSKIDASFTVTSPVLLEGTMSGQWYESDGSATMSLNAIGLRMNGEVRSVTDENSDIPSLYMNISGLDTIEALLSLAGPEYKGIARGLSEIDGEWYTVDKSLLSQLIFGITPSGGNLSNEDLNDMISSLFTALRDTMFSADPDNRMFTVLEEVGTEDFEGTETYRYVVGLHEENTRKFISTFADSLESTGAFDYLGVGEYLDRQSFIDSMNQALDRIDTSKATADVWVESGGAYIRNIRMYPDENNRQNNYIDFGIPYEKGDSIPFVMRMVSKDGLDEQDITLGIDIDQNNSDTRLWANIAMLSDSLNVVASGEVAVQSSDEQVSVDKPESSQSIYNLFDVFNESFTSLISPSLQPQDNDTFQLPLDDFEL